MQWAKTIHVIGNILWLGGGVIAALTMLGVASDAKETRAAVAKALRTAVLYVVTPGMLLSWVGGLANLLSYWTELYAKAPWMHTKLTVGLVATAFSGVLTGRLRRAAAHGGDVSPGAMKLAGAALLLSAVAGVVLAMLRFGG